MTSSQISATVADCLRRLDDIAYLRWTTAAKNLGVTRIREDAIGLVMYPSPQLVFDEAAVPPISPPVAPGAASRSTSSAGAGSQLRNTPALA